MYYVYSLKCKNGFYVGCTDNINDRLRRHRSGHVPATKDRLPISLEFYFAVNGKHQAFEFEKYLKSGSGRAFVNKHLVPVALGKDFSEGRKGSPKPKA
ncbi:MAG: GIY-YIG nuclease family protein [Candidatus Wildermuthbacteria bacterium]|nr:GIY-YIG nuclease family protein [Candidatus Wildermuthbacteria bacterium]